MVRALTLVLLLSSAVLAQEKSAAEKAKQAEIAAKVESRIDQKYAGTDNPFQMLDLYLPKTRSSDKPLPVIVYIHGGGWINGSRKGYANAAMAQAASGNYAAASIGYRLSREAQWPAQIHDCKAAIRWIRGHAKEFNLDPDRIGATGSSAGGHLVTMLGQTAKVKELEGDLGEYTSQPSHVTCVVNFCGPSDLVAPLMQGEAAEKDDPAVSGLIGGSVKDRADVAKAASPLTYVNSQGAPNMTVHGTKDMRVNYDNATKLDAALKKAGVESLLIPITDGGHGINGGPELAKRVQQYFDLHLRGMKTEIETSPIPTQTAGK